MEDNIPAENPSPAPQRRGRTALWTLAALYAVSAVAAGVILMRGPKDDGRKEGEPRRALALLSAAKKDAVGWITISGPIFPSEGSSVFSRGMPQWTRSLRKMAEKKEIKAIVLEINSPGGSVGSVQELHSLVLRVRRESNKPVVALLGDVAASGGYYVAAACDKVVAYPGTLVGSIGVIFQHSNVEGLLKKVGVQSGAIKSGKMKDIGSMTRPMTVDERALLQGLIDDAYGQFLSAVAEGRKMPEDKLRPLADGRIFSGRQALAFGLVDKLGDSDDAAALAGELGGIAGKPRIVKDADALSEVITIFESRLGRSFGVEAAVAAELGLFVHGGLAYMWVR